MDKQYEVGYDFPSLTKPAVTKVQLTKYAGASGDFNPLHLDDRVGKEAGIGGVIAHGMLIMGMAGEAIGSWVPRISLKGFSVRFKAMTVPGEVITLTGRVVDKEKTDNGSLIICQLEAKNQSDEIKLSGRFTALF